MEDTPVHKAVREALANCLVNTDFYLPRGVFILKERDQIIMQNPGSIRTGKDQMLRGGISDPRNKAIMKMLNLISIGERAGSGVPDIYAVWADKGWLDPVVEEQYGPDRTILTLSFLTEKDEANHEANEANHEANMDLVQNGIMKALQHNPRITQTDLAVEIGVSRATIQRTMKKMVESNLITRIGATRGYWKINE